MDTSSAPRLPWYRELNAYHWIVFVVCTLGWAFDCMDQHLFTYVRALAIGDLMGIPNTSPEATHYATLATSVMMIGWATGGIIFGIIGDKYGRAKTMIFTILIYSLLTGLSAFSVTIWDFMLIRFLAGLGIGGQFAVGASLVAETMPQNARPYVLGVLQAFSAVGNIGAALVSMTFNHLHQAHMLPFGLNDWRGIFLFGSIPAVLAYFVIRYLREPESWQKSVSGSKEGRQHAGSVKEMFTDPVWRRHVILGMILAAAGVIGCWGIGMFSLELSRIVAAQLATKDPKYRDAYPLILEKHGLTEQGLAEKEADVLQRYFTENGKADQKGFDKLIQDVFAARERIFKQEKIATDANSWTYPLYGLEDLTDSMLQGEGRVIRDRFPGWNEEQVKSFHDTICVFVDRRGAIGSIAAGISGSWSAWNLLFLNLGAFLGMYSFPFVTGYIGRRWTFTLFLTGCVISTVAVFQFMNSSLTQLTLVPIMGFFQFSMFSGYTIYFPELFPTRLRSTGVSFCYNVGRYVAAGGPILLGLLTHNVYGHLVDIDPSYPLRYAGTTMCAIFVMGIVAVWFLPETKGKPLPE